MRDFRKNYKGADVIFCFVNIILTLCQHHIDTKRFDSYDYHITCPEIPYDKEKYNEFKETFIKGFEKLVKIEEKGKRVVLLFDEAYHLIREEPLYNALRWWLRINREQNIVAVFADRLFSLNDPMPLYPDGVDSNEQNVHNNSIKYKNYSPRTRGAKVN